MTRPEGTDSPLRIEVDGEVFDVANDRPGQYDYAWVTGRNAGYGFTAASTAARPDHIAAIRSFLAQVDPETGYLE